MDIKKVGVYMKFLCPYCNVNANDTILYEHNEGEYELLDNEFPYKIGDSKYQIIKCSCCDKIFFYESTVNEFDIIYSRAYPNKYHEKNFSECIQTLSINFTNCFNQSLKAQSEELDYLVGAGLRKSLEYLVKDFVSYIMPEKSDEIRMDNNLSNIICNRLPKNLEFDGIKELAKRVWWVGSDYAHTSKKYDEYDEYDLITLLELLVLEIERYFKKKEYISNIARR